MFLKYYSVLGAGDSLPRRSLWKNKNGVCQMPLSNDSIVLYYVLIDSIWPSNSVYTASKEYGWHLTVATPRMVIPKSNKPHRARHFDAVLNLDPSGQGQEARRAFTLCVAASFRRVKSFFFTQGYIFEPTTAVTWTIGRTPDFLCRGSPICQAWP